MSSFIISKVEYIKAAGLMYGIESSKRDSHKYFLDVCRKEFEHAYALNVASVNEQYSHDEPRMPDGESYDAEFATFRDLGKRICEGRENRMTYGQLRQRLHHFFGSVLYQIENDAAHRMVAAWFYACLSKLYERELHSVNGWWGEVELLEDLDKAA